VALMLGVIEAGLLFGVVLGGALLWEQRVPNTAVDVATVLTHVVAACACCIVAFYYNDLYNLRVVWSFRGFAARLLSSLGLAFVLLALLYAVVPDAVIDEGTVALGFLVTVAFVLPVRGAAYALNRSGPFCQRIVILGSGPFAAAVAREIERQPHLRYRVVGMVEDTRSIEPPYPVVGRLEDLDGILRRVRPDRLIVALTERRGRMPVQQLLEARMDGVAVESGVAIYERLTGKLAIESLTPSNVIFSPDFRKAIVDLAAGRALSLLVAVAGLVVLAPVIVVIALAIKLDSGSPVLYVHDRVGLRGRRFKLLKFRTMRRTGPDVGDWTRDQSDRVTRVGKWLRRFRLDELPQFINILRGDMNLVGPRPHRVAKYEAFLESIPYFSLRAIVRPGLTGWAQVRYGYATRLDEETEKVRYDLYYVKHVSFALDLRILFDTVKIVVFGRGSRARGPRLAVADGVTAATRR
jgi:exopolysaccharide biosynthesis polyprenyl glycosylphosphotransferase